MRHKREGGHCLRSAAPGAVVCVKHGARAPQVVAAAKRRIETAQASRAAATYGLPRVVDPHTALLEELHRTAGHVAWLGELVASLRHEDDTEPTVLGDGGSHDPTEPHTSKSGLKQYTRTERFTVEQESVWLRMYREERTHLARVAKDCIAAGIAERTVRLAEDQGRLIAEVVRTIVTGLGRDLSDPAVREVVEPAMRLVRPAA